MPKFFSHGHKPFCSWKYNTPLKLNSFRHHHSHKFRGLPLPSSHKVSFWHCKDPGDLLGSTSQDFHKRSKAVGTSFHSKYILITFCIVLPHKCNIYFITWTDILEPYEDLPMHQVHHKRMQKLHRLHMDSQILLVAHPFLMYQNLQISLLPNLPQYMQATPEIVTVS